MSIRSHVKLCINMTKDWHHSYKNSYNLMTEMILQNKKYSTKIINIWNKYMQEHLGTQKLKEVIKLMRCYSSLGKFIEMKNDWQYVEMLKEKIVEM